VFALAAAAVAQQPPASPDEKKAREAFEAGKVEDALAALRAAARANPNMMPPRVVVSRWLVEAKQGPAARQQLEQAAAEDPDHPDVLLTNGYYALGEGRLTDAVLSFGAALTAAGTPRWDADVRKRFQREARLGLVDALNARGDQAAVRTHLLVLLEADPKNPRYRLLLARATFLLGRPDDALAELQTAHRDDPTVNPPELEMAGLWSLKADHPKVEEWYAKAAQAHPNSAAVHRGFGGYWLERGKPDAARPHLEAAQKLDPNGRETKALAGLMARYRRDYPAAAAVFEDLVREHPNFPFATSNLALVLAESADAAQRKRAVELAEAYVRLNPRQAEAHAVYGYALLKNDRPADAEKALSAAASLGVLSPDAAYFVASGLAKKEMFDQAAKVLRDALGSTAAFVYRPNAQALLAAVEKKLPKKP
jgi:tetratricopeptide (TPR) repeat protein